MGSLRVSRYRLAAMMAEALYETEEECAAVLRALQKEAIEAAFEAENYHWLDGVWQLKIDALLDGPEASE